MPALTRDEAQTRARLLEVHRYSIDLDLTDGDELFGSTTVIGFTAREAGDTFVEVRPAALRRVVLDGHTLDPAALADGRYPLDGLTPGEHELRIEARMRYSRTGEGMHRFTDPADGETYLYTMCCMTDGPSVFAAFDQPDLKAVFDVRVTAPPAWTVIGNGIARRTDDHGHWQLATTPPISTYLMAVAAGPYHSVHAEHAGLPLGLHARRSLADHLDADAAELFDITRRCFDRYHEIFDEPYPFDSYDQAFVPEFNAGAMENPGLVTFRDEFVYRSAVTDAERETRGVVIAHEMAHMWFGDLVTMQWWDDIWLNESFAEYMGYQVLTEATRFQGAWTEFAIARKSWGYDADQRPSTHPVAPEPDGVPDTEAARLNFDGISYSKGASALRQLVAWLGEKDFLAGINDHFARHRFGNATLDDFLDSLARASGQDVHAWAARWLRTTGVDTLTPDVTTRTADGDATRHTWNLDVRHTGNRPHHIAVTAYDRAPAASGTLTLRDTFELGIPADGDPGPRALTGPRPDLVLINDQDLSYAKVRLDPASWTTVRQSLSGLPDALTRSVIWNAARDMVRDGELPPADYLATVRDHLPHENDIAVVRGVLAFTRSQLADRYLAPQDRTEALAVLTDVSRRLLARTDDGTASGLRLTAVRGIADNTDDAAELRAWLTDGTVPQGPRLDLELRWRVLERLAVLGTTTTGELDAELARDPSATGQEAAARCRAALPDPGTKAEAWKALFETDELSNYLFTATAQGFWQPEQHDLLEDYLPRYHPAAVAVAERRGAAIADAAGRWAYPGHAVHPDTRGRTEECLRDADPVPALRRRLVDNLADLDRALHVRGR